MLTKVKPALQLKDISLFRQQCYIDGKWVDADDKSTLAVNNPADGLQIGTIPKWAPLKRAAPSRPRTPPGRPGAAKTAKERATILRKWFDLMMANQEDLAVLMTTEQGKPLAESKGEIAYGASFIEWFAEEGKRIYGDVIPQHQADKRIVCHQAADRCVRGDHAVELSERNDHPQSGSGARRRLHDGDQAGDIHAVLGACLCELAERAGIPKGVINVVTGSSGPIGNELTTTRSCASSLSQARPSRQAVDGPVREHVKKVSLELGGNAPFIVFDDADIEAAVEGAMASKFRNTGQTCVCANRLFVQDGVYDNSRKSWVRKSPP
jgi:succinate-semialdehyde dehydrogenase/glutarate-semialdehyde dehydrogenase